MKRTDPIGMIFGRLSVTDDAGSDGRNRFVMAKCCCGSGPDRYRLGHLMAGATRSCGCFRDETVWTNNLRHGGTGTRTYSSWAAMWQRCTNPKSDKYHRYGGRGISICQRWKDFSNFYADMGERPTGTTIDRVDSDGNYEPGNCRWAAPAVQAINKSVTRFVVLDGERMPISHASRKLGLGENAVGKRLARGWSIEKALNGRGSAA